MSIIINVMNSKYPKKVKGIWVFTKNESSEYLIGAALNEYSYSIDTLKLTCNGNKLIILEDGFGGTCSNETIHSDLLKEGSGWVVTYKFPTSVWAFIKLLNYYEDKKWKEWKEHDVGKNKKEILWEQ